MNKTKIDWADSTWNPVTGCLHGCPYCYARTIANRFGGASETHCNETVGTECQWETETTGELHVLEEPIYDVDGGHNAPYPFYFDPTFHKYRLEDYAKKKGRKIFVCSMADLFGKWVPDKWILDVLSVCEQAPQHQYLFLSKNPERYGKPVLKPLMNRKNYWFGTTVTNKKDMEGAGFELFCTTGMTARKGERPNRFLSIEPLLERLWPVQVVNVQYADWVIVGAESGNRKDKVLPEKIWVMDILKNCREYGTPVFMKESLRAIMGSDFVQEWPEGMGK